MLTRRSMLAGAAAMALPATAGAGTAYLEQLVQLPPTSSNPLRAMINGTEWMRGLGRVAVWDARGPVYTINGSSPTVLLDVNRERPGLYLVDTDGTDARSGGLRWVAQHPNFSNSSSGDPILPGPERALPDHRA